MPPKQQRAAKAGSSSASSRGATSRAGSSRGATSRAGSSRGASSSRARGARRGAARGRGAGGGGSFLEQLVLNPSMMGDFMKFYGGLAKALDKRDKKSTAQRLGLGGDDDDDEEEEDSDRFGSDSSESCDEVPVDDIDGYAHRTLAGMAAKMGCLGDLRNPGDPLSDEDESESDDDLEMNEMVAAMTSEESSSEDEEKKTTNAQPPDGAIKAGPSSAQQPAAVRVKYVRFRDEDFAAAVAGATRIARLSLTKLIRTREADPFLGDVKPDKHIEAVLKALGGATKNVTALHLEDAEWATCKLYSPMLVKLLAGYKKSLRTLTVTNRLLLQPNGKQKNCIWKVVSGMPNLEELRLTYVSVSLHYYTYRGELREDEFASFAPSAPSAKVAKRTPAVLPALKSVHLHLTEDWFQRQFHNAITDDEDYEDFEYENVGGGEREEEQEDFLEHLLRNRKDVITVLGMSCVQKTRMELEIVDLLADLPNVLSIGVRVEMVPVTTRMSRLVAVSVEFHYSPAPKDEAVAEAAALIASAPASWAGLKSLSLNVPRKAAPRSFLLKQALQPVRKVQQSWNQVLAAAAGTCRSLTHLTLQGSGWGSDALQQVLAGNPALQSVVLDQTARLEPRHLALLKDMAALKSVHLNAALREDADLAAQLAQCQEAWAHRAVDVQWVEEAATRT